MLRLVGMTCSELAELVTVSAGRMQKITQGHEMILARRARFVLADRSPESNRILDALPKPVGVTRDLRLGDVPPANWPHNTKPRRRGGGT